MVYTLGMCVKSFYIHTPLDPVGAQVLCVLSPVFSMKFEGSHSGYDSLFSGAYPGREYSSVKPL